MDISSIKTEGGKVSCETPEGTVVHININQRSALDCLLDTFRFLRDLKKSEAKARPIHVTGSAGHLGFGVAFLSSGLVSVMLAITVLIVQPSLSIFYSGVHFWVGFPFLVSGLLNLVAYKFPKTFWRALAFISLLVNFGVSIGGMVIAVNDIQRFRWYSSDDICNQIYRQRGYYDRTTPPPRYYNSYEHDYYLDRCKEEMQRYKMLVQCLTYMTLLMMIWGLCLAILSVVCRVKSFCGSCKLESMKENDGEALIKPNPADDILIA